MATATYFSRRLGAAVRELGSKGAGGGWYGSHMAAADCAIRDRLPLVDLVLEIRDARIPVTSTFESLGRWSGSNKHLIVLNKVDLADRSWTEKWVKHIGKQNCICHGVNAHNRENIKELLSIIRARIKELKFGESSYTATVLLVGIPNVGKSAIVNSMHQIGRIGAAEKGKLKHAVVSLYPGETKDISSYKIASHPNIYVLDTPGILSPKVVGDDSGSKLALTRAIKDSLLCQYELAQYFLAVFNSTEEYKQWENFNVDTDTNKRKRRQYSSDHTQDFVVKDVRRTLFKTISSFKGVLGEETEMELLIESQLRALQEAFRVSEASENGYRTGKYQNELSGRGLTFKRQLLKAFLPKCQVKPARQAIRHCCHLDFRFQTTMKGYSGIPKMSKNSTELHILLPRILVAVSHVSGFPACKMCLTMAITIGIIIVIELWRSSPDQIGKIKRLMQRHIPQPMAIVERRSRANGRTFC
ncbi:DAR GTPase 2, mitochondrial isoform X3 [Typha angustifolia]|uniref:DAR GTPase 2, mitochondrial isoform X3 n=1 Tax=Typha angustifolia TaxID=59011 RepID=UPI003C2DF216